MLEFDAEGIDNVFSSALASIVRKEVIKASDYKLVDRNSMNEILAEQGLSQSGCVSSECAVEVGKLLGVQQMVSGSLSALGSLFLLDINIIDVSTGEIIKTESVEHIGKIEELISPLRTTVKSMLGGSILNVGEALIYIESIPSGAMVYMNGEFVGSSPLKHTIDTKSYNITLKAKGYTDWFQEIKGKTGETVLVKAELLESRVSLEGGLTSNEVGKWEVLGISREEYIDFLRLGIDERDWIEILQPAGISISDYKKYYKYNLPIELWTKLAHGDVSIKPILELSKNNIDDEHWLFCIENEISGELAHEFLLFNIPKTHWVEYKNIKKYHPENINLKFKVTEFIDYSNRVAWFIKHDIIEIESYILINDKFGSDVKYLFAINNIYDIAPQIMKKITKALNDQTLNAKTLPTKISNWKQRLYNKIIESHNFKDEDSHRVRKSVSEITPWEWVVATHLNISINDYVEHYNEL